MWLCRSWRGISHTCHTTLSTHGCEHCCDMFLVLSMKANMASSGIRDSPRVPSLARGNRSTLGALWFVFRPVEQEPDLVSWISSGTLLCPTLNHIHIHLISCHPLPGSPLLASRKSPAAGRELYSEIDTDSASSAMSASNSVLLLIDDQRGYRIEPTRRPPTAARPSYSV